MKEVNSLYIHFPFCRHLCNYCDFYKHKFTSVDQINKFEDQLKSQIDHHNDFLCHHGFRLKGLETLYIGGGTPSLWKTRGASFIKSHFDLAPNCEFTIEVDPDTWSEEEIDFWREVGVNRFSIGTQSFSKKFLKVMDRTHSLADVEKTLKYFSNEDLNFSVDLMLGLPKSKERSIINELEDILKYKPKHLSVYILKTRSNYPLNDYLPEDDFIREEYLKVSDYLKRSGYEHYEVSNFAKDGFRSKHNQKYWLYKSVAALGANATGVLVKDNEAIRYQWKSVSLGIKEDVLKGESLLIEKLFLALRFHHGVNFKKLFIRHEQQDVIEKLIKKWKEQNYLTSDSVLEQAYLTSLGYLMCDSLIDDIFKEVDF